jgi:asparagine synthase (glutamine-hydrolysing)
MAGIVGIKGENSGEILSMIDRIKHRGPDGTWVQGIQDITLGCLELEAGGKSRLHAHYTSDGLRAVVVDGRIYNAENADMTDAEAVLDFYDKYGDRFAGMLDGDFACAICDNGTLLLSRDSAGIKPLYYGHINGKLCFASEAKALVGMVNDIKEFPPGYIYSRDLGFQKYTNEAVQTPEFEDIEQAKDVIVRLLREATERRMKDGAVGGIFLSGGLDSSIVACLAKEINPDLEAFTVCMEGANDLPLARDVAEYLGLKHTVCIFGEKEIKEILPKAICYLEMFEESCVHGAIANLLAAKLAMTSTRCVLTGEGADEFFAGYDGQFKRGKDPEEVAFIVDELINRAYNTALQRLDRLNAACSLEPRTPFLDFKVMDFCRKIPLSYKIHDPDNVGKWILRRAFENCLPDHILFQTKRFFAQGSGVAQVMRGIAKTQVAESDLESHNDTEAPPHLASIEELYYYQLYKKTFPNPVFGELVNRWVPSRPDFFLR